MEILIFRKAEKQLGELPKEIHARIKEIFVFLRDKGMSSDIEIKNFGD